MGAFADGESAKHDAHTRFANGGAAMNPSDIGVTLAVIAQAPQAYSAFLPSIMTIRTFVGDERAVKDIRDGEIFGSAFVLMIGAAGSMLTKKNGPFLVSLASIAIMLGVYEYALRSRRGNKDMTKGAVS